jgi:N-acetyl-anhydromuramoyl-L-alanine amidase
MHHPEGTYPEQKWPNNNRVDHRRNAAALRRDGGYRIDASGWLQPVARCPSENFNQRPTDSRIDLLVIHNISLPAGRFGGGNVEALFSNRLDCGADESFADLRELKVSAHLLIGRAGSVTQFVAFWQRAWHAGQSLFEGRPNCNDFSIGIELEGTDALPYTDAQYASLAAVTRALCRHYPGIVPQRIVGHSDIAPLRKSDPGPAFDWPRFKGMLATQANALSRGL